MELLTDDLRAKLLANGKANAERLADPENQNGETHDFRPVVKLFNPCGAATWLLTELEPEDPDIAFGLCDLGFGSPELGRVSLSELQGIELLGGALGIERDIHFEAGKRLSVYAEEARTFGRIDA